MLKTSEMIAVAHKPKSMIKKCTFMGCEEQDACKLFKETAGVSFITPVYGLCYTFNFGPYLSSLNIDLDMVAANVVYGLTLEIDIECKKRLAFLILSFFLILSNHFYVHPIFYLFNHPPIN